MAERCLQSRTGSCAGCNIHELLKGQLSKNSDGDPKLMAMKVHREFCSEGTQIQIPNIERKQRVW